MSKEELKAKLIAEAEVAIDNGMSDTYLRRALQLYLAARSELDFEHQAA